MTPELVIEAMAGWLLSHIPPLVGVTVVVLPTQIEDAANLTKGIALTVTEIVFEIAGTGSAQASIEVNSHVTNALFTGFL
jgi:hypothetical protein